MSAQAGVFYFDGRQVPPEVDALIRGSLDQLRPDSVADHLEPGVAMHIAAFHVTHDDHMAKQPFMSNRGIVMTWDGRLDNRDDLLLQLRSDLRDDLTDGAIALAVYERWGEPGLAQLVGDWSFVLFDREQRTLKMASDYMGVRPLYFVQDAHHVAWSSTLGGLIQREDRRDDLDSHFMIGFIVGVHLPDLTPYAGIKSVTPAHCLTFHRDGSCRAAAYWHYETRSLHYHNADSYQEHLRAVLQASVRSRLRSTSPVWLELSGGLDSSLLVCMADHLVKHDSKNAPGLETVSIVTDSSPAADERRFVAAVEKHCGRNGHRIPRESQFGLFDSTNGWITPQHPRDESLRLLQLVSKEQARLLFSGMGGDTVFANNADNSVALVAHLRRCRIGSFLRYLRAWSRASQRPAIGIAAETLPLLLRQVRLDRYFAARFTTRLKTPVGHYAASGAAPGAWPAFLLRASEHVKSRALRVAAVGDVSKEPMLDHLMSYADTRFLQSPSELPQLTYTYPYLDRRLVEFVLAVPMDVLAGPQRPRGLMRDAFSCLLPEEISRRFSKGFAATSAMKAARAGAQAALRAVDQLSVVKRDYATDSYVRLILGGVGASADQDGRAAALLLLEQWLERREHGASTSRQPLIDWLPVTRTSDASRYAAPRLTHLALA